MSTDQQPLLAGNCDGSYGSAAAAAAYAPPPVSADFYVYPAAPVTGYVMQNGQVVQQRPGASTQWGNTFAGGAGRIYGDAYNPPGNDDCCPCAVQ